LEDFSLDGGVFALVVLDEDANVCLWRYYVRAVPDRVGMVSNNFANSTEDSVEFF